MSRTIFLIDGFNVYHSLKQASMDLRLAGRGTRWLNLNELCRTSLSSIGAAATLEGIIYFSAYAKHRIPMDADVINRHK